MKPLVSEILKHLFEQTTQSEIDLKSATESFLSKNINSSGGPVSLVRTCKYLIELGAVKIVDNALDFFESALNGRADNEFILLQSEVLSKFQ